MTAQRLPRAGAFGAAIAVAGLVLAGCGPEGAGAAGSAAASGQAAESAVGSSYPVDGDQASSELGRDPTRVDAAASEVDLDVALPLSWSDSLVVSTGWRQEPQTRADLIVGFEEQGGELVYSAMDSFGTVLWQASRPATCTGFAMSMAGGRPIVVLTDADVTSPAAAETDATDVGGIGAADGVDVTGGPGGAAWQTTATGYDAATGETLWTAPAETVVSTPADRAAPRGAALITDAGQSGADLLGLATGGVLAAGTDDAAYEPLSDTWLWVDEGGIHGASATHDEWSRTLSAPPRIAAAAMGLVYLRVGNSVQVLNALTGEDAIAYPDADEMRGLAGFAVPVAVTADAAGLFRVGGRYVLAAVERPPA